MRSVRSTIGYCAMLTGGGFLLYLPVLDAWFVGDDLEEILGGHEGGSFATQNIHPGRNFRPLNLWVHDLVYGSWGLNPVPFHLISVALHVAASVLVALTARALGRASRGGEASSGTALLAWLGGAVFLVMPNHTEAVSWISARGDLMMTCFVLVSLLCWLRPGDSGTTKVVGLVAFGLALTSKESAVVLPFLLSLIEVTRDGVRPFDPGRVYRAAMRPWGYYLALVGYLVVRRISLGTLNRDPLWEEFVGDSIPQFVKRSAALVVRSWLPGMGAQWWILVAVVIAVVAGWEVRRRSGDPVRSGPGADRRWPYAFLLAAPVVALVPVAHLGASATNSGGERLVYLPSAFVAVLAGWLLSRMFERSRIFGIVGIAVVVAVSSGSLVVINYRWSAAGDMARSLAEQMENWPRDRQAYLFSTPDNLDGAYVFRNALGATAVMRHGWSNPPNVAELSLVRAAGPMDRIVVGPGRSPNVWRLRLTNSHSAFVDMTPPSRAWTVKGVDVTRVGPREIEARFPETVSADQIWYYSEGQLSNLSRLAGG